MKPLVKKRNRAKKRDATGFDRPTLPHISKENKSQLQAGRYQSISITINSLMTACWKQHNRETIPAYVLNFDRAIVSFITSSIKVGRVHRAPGSKIDFDDARRSISRNRGNAPSICCICSSGQWKRKRKARIIEMDELTNSHFWKKIGILTCRNISNNLF